jgi:mannan endo-1,4-beta-mannosidase
MKPTLKSPYPFARLLKRHGGAAARVLLVLACLTAATQSHGQLTTKGRFVYNQCGEKVIFRGVEHMLYWFDVEGAMISEIASTGANYIRVMLDPAITGEKLREVLVKCVDQNRMYVSVAIWKPWQNRGFWNRPDIKKVLQSYESALVIHGYGEGEFSNDDARWLTEVKSVITSIREAGYKCPIDVISTSYGRDPRPVLRHGSQIVKFDPRQNIIMGVQLYWGKSHTEDYGMSIAEACTRFARQNFPIQVGACPSDCNSDCGSQAWREAHKNQLGCMWWSWYGDEFALSRTGKHAELTSHGREVLAEGPYSLRRTALRYSGCPTNTSQAVNAPD